MPITWEIAIIAGMVGISFILLTLSNKINKESEQFFPIQLIFVTLALLFGISGLRLSSLIVQANESTIGNATVSASLLSILDQAFIVMNWIFYLFAIITILTVLVSVIQGLMKMKWG